LLSSPAHAGDPLADLEKVQHELFNRVAPAVVFINSGDGIGSGFFVSDDGRILTNAHVVGNEDEVTVVLYTGETLTGEVVELAEEDIDLALVQLRSYRSEPLELADSTQLEVGDWVGAVGHGLGGIWTYNTGMVSNIYPAGSEHPVFQTQIPLNQGNSGGPIFDRRGAVVGIVTAGIMEANNINFGIKIDVAQATLSHLASEDDCLVIHAPDGVAVFVDGKMVGTGPKVVFPAKPGTHEVFAIVDGRKIEKTVRFPDKKVVDLR